MTTAAWVLALLGVALTVAGYLAAIASTQREQQAGEHLARVHPAARDAIRSKADSYTVLGLGVMLSALSLVLFMIASVLP